MGAERLKDPKLDAMIDKERATTDQDQRYKACIDIQQYIADQMYMIGFMPGANLHEALQPWVKNFYPSGNISAVGDFGTESIGRLWLQR